MSLFGSILLISIVQETRGSQIQQENGIPEWVYMVYCDADNNLDSYGINDINEMEQGFDNADVSHVKVICFIDRYYSGATTYQIVHDTSSSVVSTVLTTGFPSEPNMGSKTTLKNFITYVFTNHPAQHYVLDLWNHGSGFGVCWDDTSSNDKLTFDEVDEAIAEACTAASETIDILAADACLMQNLEWIYENNEYVDFIVSSQETIPGYGYPYDLMIDSLCDDWGVTPANYAIDMVNDYHNDYTSSYDTTLSAVDVRTASFTNLMNAFNIFTANMTIIADAQRSAIASARAATQEFYYTTFIDLQDFAEEVKTRIVGQQYKDACDVLITSIQSAVLNTKQHNNPDAHGISIYFPETSSSYDSGYSSVIDLGEETGWDEFLDVYYNGPAYKLKLEDYTYHDYVSLNPINDNDGIAEQGETINVSITIKNTGTMDATLVNGTLSCASPYINITIAFQDYGDLTQGTSRTLDFQFNVSLTAPDSAVITFTFLIQAMFTVAYQKYESLVLVVAQSTLTGGDSFENALLISAGIYDSLMPGPDPIDGSAWFRISVPAGKFLIVTIMSGAGGSDFDIYLYDPSGTFLTAAIKSTYPDSCSTYAQDAGHYRIRIYPYDGSGSFTFNVTISDTTGPEDGLSIGTAISLSRQHPTVTDELPAATPDGEMYFRVFLQEGERITVWLRGDSGESDFDLYLYDYWLNLLDYSLSYNYPEEIRWTAEYTGYHYLIVDIWDGSGEFEIEVKFGSASAIPFGGWMVVGLGLLLGIIALLWRQTKYHRPIIPL